MRWLKNVRPGTADNSIISLAPALPPSTIRSDPRFYSIKLGYPQITELTAQATKIGTGGLQ